MSALSLLLATAAFALFGLATVDHHRQRLGRPPSARGARRMRLIGWSALALSFPPAIADAGWIFGPILWAGSVMLGAGIVFLALNLLPARGADGGKSRTGPKE